MHADYTLPKETATDGLKVPVIYEDSPYYAAPRADYTQLGRRPRARRARRRPRPFAPFFNAPQHEPDDQHDLRVDLAAARLRRRALRVARHRQLRRLPDLRRAERDARRDGGHRLAQRPRARPTRRAPARRRGRRRTGQRATVGMMGTSYNGTIPIAAATTGVAGPRRRSSRSRRSPTGTTTTAPTAWSRAALRRRRHRQQRSWARTSTCSSTTSTRATTRTRPARMICRR